MKFNFLTNCSDSEEKASMTLVVLRSLPLPQSPCGHASLDISGVLNQFFLSQEIVVKFNG